MASFRIPDHLNDKGISILIKTHGNGIDHQRLTGNQLQSKTRLYLKLAHKMVHGQMGRSRQILDFCRRFLRYQKAHGSKEKTHLETRATPFLREQVSKH